MLGVVVVHVRVHRHPGLRQALVVLGARQGREDEELQDVHRQFALDDGEVAADGLRGVFGKAQDVARVGQDPGRVPGLEHGAVIGDLVLALLGGLEGLRVDVLQPQEGAGDPGLARLLDEVGDAVGLGVHLDHQLQLDALAAQGDDAVEDRLPVGVAGEVVVGDEEILDPLGPVGAHQGLHVVGGAVAGLAALDIDDGAEAALVGAAAPGVEARPPAHGQAHPIRRQDGGRGAGHVRQVGQIVVEGLQAIPHQVLEQLLQAALQLPGEQADAKVHGLAQIHRHLLEHRQAAADVEAADGDLHAQGAELPGQVHGPGELVGLDPHHAHQHPAPVFGDLAQQAAGSMWVLVSSRAWTRISTSGPSTRRSRTIQRDAVDRRQAVGRERGAPPLDHIAVVVVVRRLDPEDVDEVGLCWGRGHGNSLGGGGAAGPPGGWGQILTRLWGMSGRGGSDQP